MRDLQELSDEIINTAMVTIYNHLEPGSKLCLVAYKPGNPRADFLRVDSQFDMNEAVSAMRRKGLSIDGDNAYKRDLLDAVVGALALGAQNTNPPPAEHWGQRFWDIGREERGLHEELVAALKLNRENLRACQATIHLCGGFDPAYVNNAQTAMKIADEALAKAGA
jgi:hypothetical protein